MLDRESKAQSQDQAEAQRDQPADSQPTACGTSVGKACSAGGCPMCRPQVLAVIVVVLLALVAGNVWNRLREIKSTEPYRMAVAEVTGAAEAQARLGNPIRDVTWFPGGRVHVEGDRGEANFVFKVAGPLSEADVYVQARRWGGTWSLTVLELRLPDGSTVSLRPGSGGGQITAGSTSSALEEAPRWVPPDESQMTAPSPAEGSSVSTPPL